MATISPTYAHRVSPGFSGGGNLKLKGDDVLHESSETPRGRTSRGRSRRHRWLADIVLGLVLAVVVVLASGAGIVAGAVRGMPSLTSLKRVPLSPSNIVPGPTRAKHEAFVDPAGSVGERNTSGILSSNLRLFGPSHGSSNRYWSYSAFCPSMYGNSKTRQLYMGLSSLSAM